MKKSTCQILSIPSAIGAIFNLVLCVFFHGSGLNFAVVCGSTLSVGFLLYVRPPREITVPYLHAFEEHAPQAYQWSLDK